MRRCNDRVDDPILAIAAVVNIGIAPGAAVESIVPDSADQNVIAASTFDPVYADAAENDVIAPKSEKFVVACAAVNHVVAMNGEVKQGKISHYPVVAITCINGIGATAAVYNVIPGASVNEVVAATAEYAVVASPCVDGIGSVQWGIVVLAILEHDAADTK